MEFKNIFKAFVVIFIVQVVNSSKILGIFWTPSRSHHIAASTLLKALARKGHDVHLLSCYNDDVDIPTYRQELLTGIVGTLQDVTNPNSTLFEKIMTFSKTVRDFTEKFWSNEPIQRLIRTKPKYDVIINLYFMNEYTLALSHHLDDTPMIIFGSSGSNALLNKYAGNPNLPYAKHVFVDAPISTFTGRLATVLMNIVFDALVTYYLIPRYDEVNKKIFPNSPSIDEIIRNNISLIFNNGHYAIESPRPNVPNLVQIGGFHTTERKKLPEEYQKFLDSAKHGAILFSMGSNIKLTKDFGEERVRDILRALGSLKPLKVLFKSDSTKFDDIPENILISKWIPQNDILAHPNMKLFITHGGLGGITETVYHGVPIIGIPIFADQQDNVDNSVRGGYGIKMKIEEINAESFEKAIKEILENSKYMENAKKRSNIFRNQPIKPLDNAIWWVEHIIEHKGGQHLRNAGIELEWYQLYMVDVMLFLLILIALILTITFSTTRFILRKIFNLIFKKPTNKKIKKK